jgi:hypothetical protein
VTGTGRRFSDDDVATLKDMSAKGYAGPTIALALGCTAEAVRKKACALGIRLRAPSMAAQRIKLPGWCWRCLETEGRTFGIKPATMARLIIERCLTDDLVCAVIDAPKKFQRTAKPKRGAWETALASQIFTHEKAIELAAFAFSTDEPSEALRAIDKIKRLCPCIPIAGAA